MNLALSRALWESSFYNPDFLYEKAEAQRGQAMRQKYTVLASRRTSIRIQASVALGFNAFSTKLTAPLEF